MRMKWMLTTCMLAGLAAITGAAALGQSGPPARPSAVRGDAQTDIGVSGYATFTNSSTGVGTHQTPSNSYGGMLEVRHISKPILGYELTFSFNPDDQKYAPVTGACALVCQNPVTPVSTKAAEFTVDYVASYKIGNLRPFLVGGLGFFVAIPGTTTYGNNTSVRGTYIGGGGVDFDLTSHLGVRAQIRDNFYKAPNVSSIYPATGVYTSSLEPMGGFYYRF